MNPFFARIPLVRLLVPFLLGIAAAYSFGIQVGLPVFLPILLTCATLLAFHRRLLRQSLRWTGLDGAIVTIAFFITGTGVTSLQLERSHEIRSPADKQPAACLVRLLKDPVVKERSVKLCVEVCAFRDSSGWKTSGEKWMCYLERSESAAQLVYGDELLIGAAPEQVSGPKNPGEFDYRAWLERQHISRQVYVKSGKWKIAAHDKGHAFTATALRLRRYFLGKLQEYGVNGPEGGVAAALLLGASDQLDPGLLQAYSASGTLHVLSVSGMHVALVYVVLLRLLAPLEKRRRGRWLSIGIQLVFLWFYATLTGLCPSVLRSVTMLSVVIAGRAFGRQAHMLNSLAASALLLLIVDPLLLYDVGFQLSYLAVAGIVLLQPELEKWWSPQNWIARQLWGLVSVTLVAQVFTFPLGLYYFRQFPTYFLLSNLVVIPLSTVTMYAGLLLLVVSPFAVIAKPVAWIFCGLIRLLNLSVEMIEQLPMAVTRSAAWKPAELLLLYGLIVLLLVFLLQRKGRWLNLALGCCFLLLTGFVHEKKKLVLNRRLIVFQVNHAAAIGVLDGEDALLLADTALAKREGDIDFHIHPFFEKNGCYDELVLPLTDTLVFRNGIARAEKGWLFAAGQKLFLAGPQADPAYARGKCDVMLLYGNTRLPLDSLLGQLRPGLVLADGSDSRRRTEKWRTICAQRHVPFRDLKEVGAWMNP